MIDKAIEIGLDALNNVALPVTSNLDDEFRIKIAIDELKLALDKWRAAADQTPKPVGYLYVYKGTTPPLFKNRMIFEQKQWPDYDDQWEEVPVVPMHVNTAGNCV